MSAVGAKPRRICPREAPGGFAMVPAWLLRREDVGHLEKLVYARLAQYAGAGTTAWPALPTLAAELGASVRQVQRALRALEGYGVLETELGRGASPSRYHFLWHPWMAEAGRGVVTDSTPPATPAAEGGDGSVTTVVTNTAPVVLTSAAGGDGSDTRVVTDPSPKEIRGREHSDDEAPAREAGSPSPSPAPTPAAKPADPLPPRKVDADALLDALWRGSDGCVDIRGAARTKVAFRDLCAECEATADDLRTLGRWLAAGQCAWANRTRFDLGWFLAVDDRGRVRLPELVVRAREWAERGTAGAKVVPIGRANQHIDMPAAPVVSAEEAASVAARAAAIRAARASRG